MKRLLLITCCLAAFVTASAYSFLVDGIAYNINPEDDKKVNVTYTSNFIYPDPTQNNYYGVTDLNIPETVKYNGKTYTVTGIDPNAFQYSPMKSITIPKTLTYVGEYAFNGCENLERVNISDLTAWCNIDFAVGTWTGHQYDSAPVYNFYKSKTVAYLNGQPLTDVVIPTSVTDIKPMTFYGWTFMKSIKLHKGVKSIINANTFSWCEGFDIIIPDLEMWFNLNSQFTDLNGKKLIIDGEVVTDVVTPQSVTKIRPGIFSSYEHLKSITFHNKVDTIDNSAFNSCTGLTTVTLPYSIKQLNMRAFGGCSNLQSIYVERYQPASINNSFMGIDYTNCTLYVPSRHIREYKYADYWKSFTNIVGWDPFPGDLNEDYETNTGDVSVLYDDILSGKTDFDLNGDGVVNTGDVSAEYSTIINQ